MVLKIGPLALETPVVLAPMAGVTDAAYRSVCRRFGGGLFVSEMITARALVERNERTTRMVAFGDDERVRSVQLYGVDPATMARAVERLVDEIGVDHIDLNFGCPVGKVTKKGGGAALPVHHVLFERVVRAAVGAAGSVPVTVKMRLGLDAATTTAFRAARMAEDVGVAAVALHARTAEQHYSGHADWSAIARLKAEVTSIPVLGNGDIWDGPDAVRMMDETGCDGVVVGRGCLGRPWLFAEIDAALAGAPVPPTPTLATVLGIVRAHAQALVALHGEERGVRALRKHAAWYLTGYPVGGAARKAAMSVSTLGEVDAWLGTLARHGELLPIEGPTPRRGPTNGPRRVLLPDRWLDTVEDPYPPAGAELLVSGG